MSCFICDIIDLLYHAGFWESHREIRKSENFAHAQVESSLTHLTSLAHSPSIMPHLNSQAKHHILLALPSRPRTTDFTKLARLHEVKGGRKVMREWWLRWDGTPQSLERREGSGRPRLFTAQEVHRHIRSPILAANRSHRAIHYPDIHPAVERKAGKNVSLRTIQRYGKEEAAAKQRHSKKRTASES